MDSQCLHGGKAMPENLLARLCAMVAPSRSNRVDATVGRYAQVLSASRRARFPLIPRRFAPSHIAPRSSPGVWFTRLVIAWLRRRSAARGRRGSATRASQPARRPAWRGASFDIHNPDKPTGRRQTPSAVWAREREDMAGSLPEEYAADALLPRGSTCQILRHPRWTPPLDRPRRPSAAFSSGGGASGRWASAAKRRSSGSAAWSWPAAAACSTCWPLADAFQLAGKRARGEEIGPYETGALAGLINDLFGP